MDKSIDVYKYVHKNEEEYLDFIDDFPSIKAFFEGLKDLYGRKPRTI